MPSLFYLMPQEKLNTETLKSINFKKKRQTSYMENNLKTNY
jgi:hypothetical protein